MFVVAPKSAVEIDTHRNSYRDPIQATLKVGSGNSAITTNLPAGLVTKPDALSNFFSVTVKTAAGKQVKQTRIGFCPNDYSAARAVPDGASTSPYPYQCGNHPFAIGDVFGIQRGWSAHALNNYDAPPSFKGKDGTYTVTLTIAPAWQKALGMTAAQSTGTLKIKVKTVKGDGEGMGAGAASTVGMAGMAGMDHSSGHLSPQMAKLHAARVRALGRPNTPNATAPKKTLTAAKAAALGPVPDLRTLPAYQIALDKTDGNGKKSKNTYLDFGATVWNAGPSPMVVDGFRRPGTKLMDAYQYFYDNNGNEVGSAPAGTLQWDPRKGHTHWHFTSFASYRLLDSTKKVALISGKEAFCLAPTDSIDLTVNGAQWRPESTDLMTACGQGEEGALSIREVLSTGWGDTYSQSLPGQSFNITKIPNGIYYIQVLANPDHKLTESDTTNNSALRKVKLGGKVGGKRTVKVYPYQGITAK